MPISGIQRRKLQRAAVRRAWRTLRVGRDQSQWDLADEAGIAHYRYWRIEQGHLTPTADERRRLSRALKVSVFDLPPDPLADDESPKRRVADEGVAVGEQR